MRRRPSAEITRGERELLNEIYPSLRRFASTIRCEGHDGTDLLQEALLRVLERGNLTDLDHPVAYVRRAMVNLAIDHARTMERERRALRKAGPKANPVPTHSWDLDELRRVPPKERAAIFLHTIEGRPYDEIGRMLGCSPVSARVAASRGRQKLQRIIERESRDATA